MNSHSSNLRHIIEHISRNISKLKYKKGEISLLCTNSIWKGTRSFRCEVRTGPGVICERVKTVVESKVQIYYIVIAELGGHNTIIKMFQHIWELGENGTNNIRLIEMTDNGAIDKRQQNHIFPPISSLKHPRLLSASIPPTRSEKKPKRNATAIGGSRHSSTQSKSNKSASNSSPKLLHSDRSNPEDFCHGLPRPAKQDEHKQFADASLTPRNKILNGVSPLSNRDVKPRSSSLRSQPDSSDGGSISSAAFRAKMASRRFSLPVTPSVPQSLLSRRSKESSKVLELSSRFSTTDKRSQRTRSLNTSSDKLSSPPSSTAARDTAPVPAHGDSLHIIQEMPAEPSSPYSVIPSDEKRVSQGNHQNSALQKDADAASVALSKDHASEDYKIALTSLALTDQSQVHCADQVPEIAITEPQAGHEEKTSSANEIPLVDYNNNSGIDSEHTLQAIPLPTQKAELLTTSSMFGDDESIIDATILTERDEDLCDADFREKRIIQWIIAAETGINVEQQVASSISPSPTNGSRETAITVIYGE